MTATTHYKVLGLHNLSTISEIRAAFKRCALALHPDKGGSKEAFQKALLAFEILSDSTSRSAYDAELLLAKNKEVKPRQAAPVPRCPAGVSVMQKPPVPCAHQCRGAGMPPGPKTSSATGHRTHFSPAAPQPTGPASGQHRRSAEMLGAQPKQPDTKRRKVTFVPKSPCAFSRSWQHCRPGAKASRRSTKCPEKEMCLLMSKVFGLLQRLRPASRREALERSFTQQQRQALMQSANADKKQHEDACGSVIPSDLSHLFDVPIASTSESPPSTPPSTPQCEDSLSNGDDSLSNGADADLTTLSIELVNEDCNTVTAVSSPFMIKDTSSSDWRRSVSGVALKMRRSRPFYQANVCVRTLYLVSREVPLLDSALDALVVLTAMKQRILNCQGGDSFEDRVRAAVPEVLQEHGLTAEQLGLGLQTMISMRFWILPPLHTPQQRSLEAALSSWSRLARFHDLTRSGSSRGLARTNPLKLQNIWQDFRTTYLDVLEEHGRCRKATSARLDALEDASKPLRERRLERWNRLSMASEDHRSNKARSTANSRVIMTPPTEEMQEERRNRMALATEEKRQRKVNEEERRRKRYELRSMAAEDALARALRTTEAAEASILRRIARTLRTWQKFRRLCDRQQEVLQREAARVKRRAEKENQRLGREAEKRRLQVEKLERAQLKLEKDSWWRWLNRPDITMAELLSCRGA